MRLFEYLAGLRYALGLAFQLSKRDLKTRYASSYGGIAWNIVVPVLYALINVVVFSALMNGRMGVRYADVPFALFYFVPFLFWQLFTEIVGRSTGILREYSFLITKIAFPVWVLPLVPLASAFLGQIVLMCVIGVLFYVKGVTLGMQAGWLILLWFTCLAFTMGVSYLISALTVYVPDLAQIIPVILNIAFWLTPILYPVTLVEDNGALWLRKIIMTWNPFFYFTEISRVLAFGLHDVSVVEFTGLALCSLLLLILGFGAFRKLRAGFSDVL